MDAAAAMEADLMAILRAFVHAGAPLRFDAFKDWWRSQQFEFLHSFLWDVDDADASNSNYHTLFGILLCESRLKGPLLAMRRPQRRRHSFLAPQLF